MKSPAARKKLAEQLVPKVSKRNSHRNKEPFPLTMQQEMALAVILWRAVRFAYSGERDIIKCGTNREGDKANRPHQEDKVNDTAIAMAERMGVKKEFFEWLFEFPVFKLYLLGLERWPAQIAGIIPKDREIVEVPPTPPKRKRK